LPKFAISFVLFAQTKYENYMHYTQTEDLFLLKMGFLSFFGYRSAKESVNRRIDPLA